MEMKNSVLAVYCDIKAICQYSDAKDEIIFRDFLSYDGFQMSNLVHVSAPPSLKQAFQSGQLSNVVAKPLYFIVLKQQDRFSKFNVYLNNVSLDYIFFYGDEVSASFDEKVASGDYSGDVLKKMQELCVTSDQNKENNRLRIASAQRKEDRGTQDSIYPNLPADPAEVPADPATFKNKYRISGKMEDIADVQDFKENVNELPNLPPVPMIPHDYVEDDMADDSVRSEVSVESEADFMSDVESATSATDVMSDAASGGWHSAREQTPIGSEDDEEDIPLDVDEVDHEEPILGAVGGIDNVQNEFVDKLHDIENKYDIINEDDIVYIDDSTKRARSEGEKMRRENRKKRNQRRKKGTNLVPGQGLRENPEIHTGVTDNSLRDVSGGLRDQPRINYNEDSATFGQNLLTAYENRQKEKWRRDGKRL